MAFQPVPDTVEITLVWTQNNESLTTILNAEKVGGYVLADLVALANNVDILVDTWLLPEMTLDAAYVRTEVRGLAVINDLFAEDFTNAGPGQDLSTGLPNNVTLAIKKSSGLTGRSARGRWYFVGMPSDNLSVIENVWGTLEVANKVGAVNGFRTGIVAALWDPVIVSRVTGGLPRAEGKRFPWLTSSAVNEFVDSQRGRLTR